AQAAWPTKPVRILTPFTAGGATDVIARSLANFLSLAIKQPVNVEPKPGADGALAAQELLRQPADGHTLYLATASALSYVPNVRKSPGYDALKDFTPLTQFMTFSFYLMVHETVPGARLAEVLAHVKANPGKYSYASGNSTALLAAAQLMASSGADMTHAPYKGESQAVVDMVGGRIHMMWASPSVMPALLKDGKFRPMAVLLPERSAAFPDVPTIGEAGMPLVNVVPWGGFVVPASTPKDVAAAVAKALREAIAHPELRAPADKAGLVLRPGTSEAFARLLVEQMAAFAQAIKQAKIPQET
ncbi:MAG: tripartite tricarboxylate transporter substrate binding protein, partial [Aquabacterium sp.]|nr:tripartite tricarboxylate transporter substrate binding protein [Aquabacterium sp.]